MTHIEQEILSYFNKINKDYCTLAQIRNGLTKESRMQTGITQKTPPTIVKKKLLPYLKKDVCITNGYKSNLFITKKIGDEKLIINAIEKKPQSSASLKLHFPIPNNRLVIILSQLISSGQLKVELDQNHKVKLSVSQNAINIADTVTIDRIVDDRILLKQAHDAVCNGRTYVRIHEIRDYLNWSKERFDLTLESLARDYAIQLHYGDPSLLTAEELKHSYLDNDGEICITLTWRDDS